MVQAELQGRGVTENFLEINVLYTFGTRHYVESDIVILYFWENEKFYTSDENKYYRLNILYAAAAALRSPRVMKCI